MAFFSTNFVEGQGTGIVVKTGDATVRSEKQKVWHHGTVIVPAPHPV
jgi:hypothetical protein